MPPSPMTDGSKKSMSNTVNQNMSFLVFVLSFTINFAIIFTFHHFHMYVFGLKKYPALNKMALFMQLPFYLESSS